MKNTAISFEDPGMSQYVPVPYRRNRNILGVYLYMQRYKAVANMWEDVAKQFAKDVLNKEYTGKGSVDEACKDIQLNWSTFIKYIKSNYKDD